MAGMSDMIDVYFVRLEEEFEIEASRYRRRMLHSGWMMEHPYIVLPHGEIVCAPVAVSPPGVWRTGPWGGYAPSH